MHQGADTTTMDIELDLEKAESRGLEAADDETIKKKISELIEKFGIASQVDEAETSVNSNTEAGIDSLSLSGLSYDPTSISFPATRKSQRHSKRTDRILNEELQFMSDFDPSKRLEQKKKKRYVVDANGRPQLLAHTFDTCDCLTLDCAGCHFPCRKCNDTKCANECRQNRRWMYESIEVEGRTADASERKNPDLTKQDILDWRL